MEPPPISILLPVYNNESTLQECLESSLDQTFPHFEVILVDDGSTDRSPEIGESFSRKDSRIHFYSTPNRGIVSALNTALEKSKGEFIVRMDGDDVMLPQRLEKQKDKMQKEPDLDLIGCCIEMFREKENLSDNARRYQNWSNALLTDAQIKREVFIESPIFHPTFFGKRTLYEQLEGYQENPWVEDYDFLFRAILKKARLGKSPEVLLKKRDSPFRLGRTDPKAKRPALFQAKTHYFIEGGFLEGKKGVVIAGSGNSGRKIADLFREREIPVQVFLDNLPSPGQRQIRGIPAFGFPQSIPPDFLQQWSSSYFILAIGDQKGTADFLRCLETAGYTPAQDFIRFV